MSVIEDVWARAGDRRACQMASAAPRLIRGAAAQPVSIRSLIEWAFAREKAQLEFEGDVMLASGYGYVSSTAAIIQQQGLRKNNFSITLVGSGGAVVATALRIVPLSRVTLNTPSKERPKLGSTT